MKKATGAVRARRGRPKTKPIPQTLARAVVGVRAAVEQRYRKSRESTPCSVRSYAQVRYEAECKVLLDVARGLGTALGILDMIDDAPAFVRQCLQFWEPRQGKETPR